MPDSYSRAQTRESVESAKNGLEYESFEYESRLDTALVLMAVKVNDGKRADATIVEVKAEEPSIRNKAPHGDNGSAIESINLDLPVWREARFRIPKVLSFSSISNLHHFLQDYSKVGLIKF